MGSKIVFRSLTELFPQIDARILKAVAIEHPKDADVAAAVVISEIVPKFCPDLADHSSQPDNKVGRDIPNGALTGSETGASSSSSSGTIPSSETRAHLSKVMPNGDVDIQSKALIGIESGVVSSEPPTFAQAGTKLTSDVWEGIDFPFTGNQAESSTSEGSKRFGDKLVCPAADSSEIIQKSSGDVREASSGSFTGENSHAELSASVLVEETSKGDPELAGAFSSSVSRLTQGGKIDHLRTDH